MDRTTIEIVLECAAALEATAFDGTVRNTHCARIEQLLASARLESRAKDVLPTCVALMREFAMDPPGLLAPEQDRKG